MSKGVCSSLAEQQSGLYHITLRLLLIETESSQSKSLPAEPLTTFLLLQTTSLKKVGDKTFRFCIALYFG